MMKSEVSRRLLSAQQRHKRFSDWIVRLKQKLKAGGYLFADRLCKAAFASDAANNLASSCYNRFFRLTSGTCEVLKFQAHTIKTD